MHHYCVVVAKTAEAVHRLGGRLERFVEDRLTFEADELVLHRVGRRTFAFSVSVAQEEIGVATPAHIANDEVCLVGGLPTFERFAQYEPSTRMHPATWVNELLRTHDPLDLRTALGGNYSVVQAGAKGVTAFASFSGLDSLFFLDNDLYAAVGNQPGLVAAFQSAGAYTAIDVHTLSWVLSTTMILGEKTPWREVRRLRTDRVLTIRSGCLRTAPARAAAHAPPSAKDVADLYDSAVHGLIGRFEWYLRTGLPFTAHLTGGKDSRLVLALLSATGSVDRVGEIVTNGSEENGDVTVARQIAAAVGLQNHVVREGAKAAVQAADWQEHEQRFRFSPWKYNMYLTPYDGWAHTMDEPSPTVTLTGVGGEIIRQRDIAPDARTDPLGTIVDRFTDWYYRHDALELLAPEVLNWQRTWIRDEVEEMIDAGTVNLQQRFYIEHRMANWANAHLCNNGASSLAPLVDLDLARLMQLRADMGDDVPYEILSRCAPQLRSIPFVNDEWRGRTMARAEADGVLRLPVEAAVAKSFPWQFALYREHRDELLRECLPSIDAWDGIVPREHLERLLAQPIEPFNSSHVKMLFGLVAGTHFLTGKLAPARDFASTTNRLSLRGSDAATALSWFEHRRIGAPGALAR